jgi:hypothetical protein
MDEVMAITNNNTMPAISHDRVDDLFDPGVLVLVINAI